MRRRLLTGTAALLAGAAAGGGGARAQQASDTAAVGEANAAIYAALSARDPRAFVAVLAEEPTPSLILPHLRAPSVGTDAIRRDFEEVFARYPEFAISMADPGVRVASGSALVTGVEAVRGRQTNGEAVSFSLIATNVFVRDGGGRWRLAHRHVSLAPR